MSELTTALPVQSNLALTAAVQAQVGTRLFMLVSEVAELVRVDERTLRRAIEAGTFPGVRIGNCIRVPVPALIKLVTGAETFDEAA